MNLQCKRRRSLYHSSTPKVQCRQSVVGQSRVVQSTDRDYENSKNMILVELDGQYWQETCREKKENWNCEKHLNPKLQTIVSLLLLELWMKSGERFEHFWFLCFEVHIQCQQSLQGTHAHLTHRKVHTCKGVHKHTCCTSSTLC